MRVLAGDWCYTLMALGFGFNKAKVLGSAEKFVQQGRLTNAITEYLKVIKEDPRDLTVMNTIGDLYVRVGQVEQAFQYFKRVGEAYAGDGFTVKAIAIYKKLNKLDPHSTDCNLKLAELYAQQGLYNDARAQYLSVADRALRSGNNEEAARIFQKMLELDPDNAAMQAKLADLYVKVGKPQQARDIFFVAAESLFRRGAVDAADEALARVLKLDAGHFAALTLRGQIAAERGQPDKAIEYLEKVPNLDSQPDALRALLRAQLAQGNGSESIPLATKLLNVHNDLSGITLCTDWLVSSGDTEAALRLYDQYADRLLAADHDGFLVKLSSATARIKENPAALELVLKLYRKSGESSHLSEVIELLAHALVQTGDLGRARDLYQELTALEPENPLHAQNYKQVSARLGDDPMTRPLTAEQSAQALMVDELEIDAPPVKQEYGDELSRAIQAALTDSELLDSYNLPSKAIAPLEAVLGSAPTDVLLNQRLASLYVRAERFSDAARCCDVLHSVYRKAGHADLAEQYAEMSAKYHQRAGEPVPGFSAQITEAEPIREEAPDAAGTPAVLVESAPAISASQSTRAVEIGLQEWEEMIAVEPPAPAPTSQFISRKNVEAARTGDVVGDLLEEIRFYISQSMWDEAVSAIEKCEALASDLPEVQELRAQLEKGRESSAAATPAVEVVEEAAPDASAPTVMPDTPAFEVPDEPPPAPEHPAHAPAVAPPAAAPQVQVVEMPILRPPAPVSKPPMPDAPRVAARAGGALVDMMQEIEDALGTDFTITPPSLPKPAAPPPVSAPAAAAAAPVAVATAPSASVAPTRPIPAEPMAIPVVSVAAATIVAPPPTAPPPLAEPASALADIFEEFKEDVEGADTTPKEDPETHYNLGVAFKDMGLLDEAIGEFQKVCQAVEGGYPFPHTLQVYTWLAECLVNKGAPQAAIKWYQRSLHLPALDEETRIAVYYEMAAAYEAAGNRQAALDNFMEVYGSNIDYRDVAERIKTLKA